MPEKYGTHGFLLQWLFIKFKSDHVIPLLKADEHRLSPISLTVKAKFLQGCTVPSRSALLRPILPLPPVLLRSCPLLTVVQPHRLPHCSSSTWAWLRAHALGLESSPPVTPMAHSCLFLISVLKCHLLMRLPWTILFETLTFPQSLLYFLQGTQAALFNLLCNGLFCQSFSTKICILRRQVFACFLQCYIPST